ncbi:unnamed protein product, partial [Mesorhabditis spiculigera]
MAAGPVVLVTGASGYLGAHCVKLLLERGYHVRGTVRSLKNETKIRALRHIEENVLGSQLDLVEADLRHPEDWPSAVRGCSYVLHVASPFPLGGNEETIHTALEGTRNVLEACSRELSVRKVVLTSSILAALGKASPVPRTADEGFWGDPNESAVAYIASKIVAERFAWEFQGRRDLRNRFALTTICPALIVGPPLTDIKCSSVELICDLFQLPIVPKIGLQCVDVRDCALAHVRAMERRGTDGYRFFLSEQKPTAIKAMAQALNDEFRPYGYRISTKLLPNSVLSTAARFVVKFRMFHVFLNWNWTVDNRRCRQILGINPRDCLASIVEMAHEIIRRGLIPKTRKYIEMRDSQPKKSFV